MSTKLREFPAHLQKWWLKLSSRDTWGCEYVYEHGAVAVWKHGQRTERMRRAAEVAQLNETILNLNTKVEALLAVAKQYASECGECSGTGRVPVGEIAGMEFPGTQSCAECENTRELISLVEKP